MKKPPKGYSRETVANKKSVLRKPACPSTLRTKEKMDVQIGSPWAHNRSLITTNRRKLQDRPFPIAQPKTRLLTPIHTNISTETHTIRPLLSEKHAKQKSKTTIEKLFPFRTRFRQRTNIFAFRVPVLCSRFSRYPSNSSFVKRPFIPILFSFPFRLRIPPCRE